MLNVVGVVINESYLIEGLVIEGKPREFGEISKQLNDIIRNHFNI